MSKRRKGCIGCGGLLGAFVILVIIIAIVDPPKKAAPAAAPVAVISTTPSATVRAAASKTAKAGEPVSPDFAKAVSYLYGVDNQRHSRAADSAVLTNLAQHCTDDPLVLSFAATNTSVDVIGTDASGDVYSVLVQLDHDVASSPLGACQSKLSTVENQLMPTASAPTSGSASGGGSTVIKSPSGNYYRAGEYCPDADAGLTTLDAEGNTLTCVMESGRYHWHN